MTRTFLLPCNSLSPDTLCPRAGIGQTDGSPLETPIVQSTTFCRGSLAKHPEHAYSRVSNPTVRPSKGPRPTRRGPAGRQLFDRPGRRDGPVSGPAQARRPRRLWPGRLRRHHAAVGTGVLAASASRSPFVDATRPDAVAKRHPPANAAGLRRVPRQSDARNHRHRGRRRCGPSGGRLARGRQHLL